jgi:prevent-host-death family protein
MYNLYILSNLYKMYIFDRLRGLRTVSATHAKQNFAAMVDAAQREPVRIQRHERDVAVLVSAERYEQLKQDRWAEFNRLAAIAAEQAKAKGLTEDVLTEILAD